MKINEIPDNSLLHEYYLTDRSVISDEEMARLKSEGQKPTVCAQITHHPQTGAMSHYILRGDCGLFDPREKGPRYKVRHNWKMRRVKPEVFDLYLKFLKTNRTSFLYQAEREI